MNWLTPARTEEPPIGSSRCILSFVAATEPTALPVSATVRTSNNFHALTAVPTSAATSGALFASTHRRAAARCLDNGGSSGRRAQWLVWYGEKKQGSGGSVGGGSSVRKNVWKLGGMLSIVGWGEAQSNATMVDGIGVIWSRGVRCGPVEETPMLIMHFLQPRSCVPGKFCLSFVLGRRLWRTMPKRVALGCFLPP